MESMITVEPGVRVYVNDMKPSGNKTIVFLHGWPANYRLFEYQYNILPHMGYRCVGIDMRGFGNSDKPWCGYSYDRLADDLLQVIKALDLHNVTLLGHSTAGAVAIRYMARHNGFGVSKLVLCAAAAPSLIQRPGFPYGQKAENIEKNFIQAAYDDRPQMLENFGKLFFYQQVTPPLSDWLFQMGLQAASYSTIAISNDWLTEELFYDLPQIQVPTLIMHGIHDQVVPYTLGIVQNQEIRNSKLITFENSGHGLFYEERDKFNAELAQFAGSLCS